jgi:hypothetical protein
LGQLAQLVRSVPRAKLACKECKARKEKEELPDRKGPPVLLATLVPPDRKVCKVQQVCKAHKALKAILDYKELKVISVRWVPEDLKEILVLSV